MKKQLLIFILALFVLSAVFSACGKNDADGMTEAASGSAGESETTDLTENLSGEPASDEADTEKTSVIETEPSETELPETELPETEPSETQTEKEKYTEAYDGLPAALTAEYFDDVKDDIFIAAEYNGGASEFSTKVVISTDREITSVKLLGLTFESIDSDGKISYSMTELFSVKTLSPQKPLIADITFTGDLPSYGLSYTDADGTLKSLTINQSGEDGRLILTEF